MWSEGEFLECNKHIGYNNTLRDYWNMTSAGLTLTGKIGDKAQLTADLTPK